MSNVIDFLERMGTDSQLRDAPKHELEIALSDSNIEHRLHAFILAGDQESLETELGARPAMVCAIAPGKDDEDREQDDRPDPDDEEVSSARPPQFV